MKKTITTLTLLASFASQAAFVAFVADSKYNIASDDPSSETGQIVGGGDYVVSEPSDGGGNEPVVVACEGPQLTRSELYNLISSGADYSKACTSEITDFSELFMMGSVDYDITGWDVSNGENFSSMFFDVISFNQDIGGWDVSNGENFSSMFFNARSFNQDIGRWNVSKGKDFSAMFSYANDFNQDLSSWNVLNGLMFGKMFFDASVFNQDLSSWNVSVAVSWHDFNYGTSLTSDNIPAKFR
ncbi:DUF285 domain-containing protein [Vibrio parahaemolyticus]|nr:DUF285 domain-containing protein [Vibrio parahaemolyticus]